LEWGDAMDAVSLEEEVGQALQLVIDPETSLSIMRMDLIHDLAVTSEGDVSLVFRPSSPICPMAYTLANAIHKAVQDLNRVRSVTINVQNFNRADHLENLLKSLSSKEP
jgi:metal-sulfur cluster biosynthetic enzyme